MLQISGEVYMKTVIKILDFALLFLIALPNVLFSQDTTICHLLGKNTQAVVNKYGKPLHQDKSDPTMECTFYQSKTSRMEYIKYRSITTIIPKTKRMTQ